MSDLFWLTDDQMARLQSSFPKSQGRPRVDDRRVATRYDRRPNFFLSAVALAAPVLF
jgi:hypothetical protein